MTRKQLNEKELEYVNGGSVDWKLFGNLFLDAVSNPIYEMRIEYKAIVEAIKEKKYIEVAEMVIPLIAQNDPLILNVIFKCF